MYAITYNERPFQRLAKVLFDCFVPAELTEHLGLLISPFVHFLEIKLY
jgi:hypothetical protein